MELLEPQLLAGATYLNITVDVAGVLTAIASLIVALLAHRRLNRLTRPTRVAAKKKRAGEDQLA